MVCDRHRDRQLVAGAKLFRAAGSAPHRRGILDPAPPIFSAKRKTRHAHARLPRALPTLGWRCMTFNPRVERSPAAVIISNPVRDLPKPKNAPIITCSDSAWMIRAGNFGPADNCILGKRFCGLFSFSTQTRTPQVLKERSPPSLLRLYTPRNQDE